jgi:hypothetical protein
MFPWILPTSVEIRKSGPTVLFECYLRMFLNILGLLGDEMND